MRKRIPQGERVAWFVEGISPQLLRIGDFVPPCDLEHRHDITFVFFKISFTKDHLPFPIVVTTYKCCEKGADILQLLVFSFSLGGNGQSVNG